MRFRNFLPLFFFLVLSAVPGALFLFAWQGYAWPILGMLVFHALLLFVVYRASVRSVGKNFTPPQKIDKQVYLPLKINLVLYFLVGMPLVLLWNENLSVLLAGYGVQIAGFIFTCYSGMLYVSRSSP